jgi:hypothetical protein
MKRTNPSTVIARSPRQNCKAILRWSDEAIHVPACGAMDCFAALAMTEEPVTRVIPGLAKREPGISRRNLAKQHRDSGSVRFADRPE